MVDKSFLRREILHLSAALLESPSAWALFSLVPYFLVVFYSQEMSLPFVQPIDIYPSGSSGRARQASFLSTSMKIRSPKLK